MAREPFAQNAADEEKPEKAPAVRMGRYYIENARPMKGTEPDADGKCFYLLRCYKIGDDDLPKDILNRELDPENNAADRPEYIMYHGHICNHKGEVGISIGYTYDCFGDSKLLHSAFTNDPTMVEATSTIMPRPRFKVDFDDVPKGSYDADGTPVPMDPMPHTPEYGNYTAVVADIEECIRINRKIEAIRYPRPVVKDRSLKCI